MTQHLADLQLIFAVIGVGSVTITVSALSIFAIDSIIARMRRRRDLLKGPRWIHRV